jgi:ATP-dependent Lhr-like helicase
MDIPGLYEVFIEATHDIDGHRVLVFHFLFGRKTNDALGRAIGELLVRQIKRNVRIAISDNGFAIFIPESAKIDIDCLMQKIAEVDIQALLIKSIQGTELLRRRFRHCAARSLLVLRNYKGYKISVSKQQLSSQKLLKVCKEVDENFPVIAETYREILEDAMDINNAKKVINWIKSGKIKYCIYHTEVPSPFAHNLILLGAQDVILMHDKKARLRQMYKEIIKRIEKNEAFRES